MSIKIVLWDLDGTLLDSKIPERNAIKKCFEDFGFGECMDAMLDSYPEINLRWWDKLETGECTKQELTVGRFSEFLSTYNLDASKAKEFNDDYMRRLGDTTCFVPNAKETLLALKGKVKQYIATNGLVIAQRHKVDNSGIDKIVDGVFISESVGFDKPSAKYFESVFDSIGLVDKSQVLMVGDSLGNDMQGGVNSGIACCWYNPNHKENSRNINVDYEIDDISKVLDIVG